MKNLVTVLALLVALSAFGADDVTVKLKDVALKGTHTNMWFECSVTIHNGTSKTFYATNLFCGHPGLALKISDLGGKEFKPVYADPYIAFALNTAIIPAGDSKFKEPYGLGKWPPFALPESVQTIRVRLEGTLSYTEYTNRLTSNIVEVRVP